MLSTASAASMQGVRARRNRKMRASEPAVSGLLPHGALTNRPAPQRAPQTAYPPRIYHARMKTLHHEPRSQWTRLTDCCFHSGRHYASQNPAREHKQRLATKFLNSSLAAQAGSSRHLDKTLRLDINSRLRSSEAATLRHVSVNTQQSVASVSYTHLTLPTNREV